MGQKEKDDPTTKPLKAVDLAGDGPESGPTPEVGWSVDKGTVRENNEDSLAAITFNQAGAADLASVGCMLSPMAWADRPPVRSPANRRSAIAITNR
jgi:hypothetical protein